VASLSQGRTAAAQCGLFTYKSVPVIFEPPCISTTKLRGAINMADFNSGSENCPLLGYYATSRRKPEIIHFRKLKMLKSIFKIDSEKYTIFLVVIKPYI